MCVRVVSSVDGIVVLRTAEVWRVSQAWSEEVLFSMVLCAEMAVRILHTVAYLPCLHIIEDHRLNISNDLSVLEGFVVCSIAAH